MVSKARLGTALTSTQKPVAVTRIAMGYDRKVGNVLVLCQYP